MGGRYFITGTQIGMLKTFSIGSIREEKNDILEMLSYIEDYQFVGNIDSDKNQRLMLLDMNEYQAMNYIKNTSILDFFVEYCKEVL